MSLKYLIFIFQVEMLSNTHNDYYYFYDIQMIKIQINQKLLLAISKIGKIFMLSIGISITGHQRNPF